MAAIVTTKKTNYLNNVINAAVDLKTANDKLVVLQAQWANAYNTGQSTPILDADCAASGATQHLTQAILTSFFSGPQAGVATAVSTNLQALLPVIPS
jgi:hypothetical protein